MITNSLNVRKALREMNAKTAKIKTPTSFNSPVKIS